MPGLTFSTITFLFQTALPLELPQVKPKRSDEGQGLGMQLRGPLGPGGKGSPSELKSAGGPAYLGTDRPRPGPAEGSQRPAPPPQSAADHLEEELDLLLNLDAPVKVGDNALPDQTPQDPESEKEEGAAQEEKGMVFIVSLLPDSGALVRTAPHPSSSPGCLTPPGAVHRHLFLCSHLRFPERPFLTTLLSPALWAPKLPPAPCQR